MCNLPLEITFTCSSPSLENLQGFSVIHFMFDQEERRKFLSN